ncbi:MAG: polysaccharide biosynthesis protein [Muribaculaceae bacterium]|nr:polysaccharide biosynthesis protein [Muribaculaceae bacterium]
MIPKVIHYCWLSDDPFPPKIQRCMDTWHKTHPDYEIKRWSTKNFDINAIPYVKEAFEARKWAFAADYIRMYALYTEGGIYLDCDVLLLKRLDEFLDNSFFSCVEYHPTQVEKCGSAQYIDDEGHRTADVFIEGIQIQAAVMGAEAGSEFVGEVLEWYKDKHFVKEDGTLRTDVLSPYIYARVAEKHGFVYKDIDQQLTNRMHIYPSETFAGNKHEVTKRSYAIHMCAHSWHLSPWEKIRKFFGMSKRHKQTVS